MTIFCRTRTQRRIATAMLLFWLFALASSWANACVLQDRHTHAHLSAGAGELDAVTVMAGHVGAVSAHGDDGAPGDSNCLDVCDAASQTSVQPDRSVDLPDLALGPPIALAWKVDVPVRFPGLEAHAALPPRAAVPPRTLLSRLAL